MFGRAAPRAPRPGPARGGRAPSPRAREAGTGSGRAPSPGAGVRGEAAGARRRVPRTAQRAVSRGRMDGDMDGLRAYRVRGYRFHRYFYIATRTPGDQKENWLSSESIE